jgi:hypothetical protein
MKIRAASLHLRDKRLTFFLTVISLSWTLMLSSIPRSVQAQQVPSVISDRLHCSHPWANGVIKRMEHS